MSREIAYKICNGLIHADDLRRVLAQFMMDVGSIGFSVEDAAFGLIKRMHAEIFQVENRALFPTEVTHAPTVDALAVIDRMKVAVAVKLDCELAKALGIPKQNVATWRRRMRTPYPEAAHVAAVTGRSLDWLIFGAVVGR